MNQVILTGRLVRDTEIRYTSNKKAVTSFTIAVDDGKDAKGEKRAQFISCVAWEKTAELIDQYFQKGDPIGIIGKLTTRSYEKDGQKRSVTEVRVASIEFPFTKQKTEDATGFEELGDDVDLPF